MSYADAIRPVRNSMRKFEYGSVLRTLSEYIERTSVKRDGRMHAPWVAERLALWVIRDSEGMYEHAPMQPSDMQRSLNMAWKAMDKEFKLFTPDKPLHLSVRTILLPQMAHQRPQDMAPFARQIDLARRLQPNSKLYQTLERSLGIAPLDYLALAGLFRINSSSNVHKLFSWEYRKRLSAELGQAGVEGFYRSILVPREKTAALMKEIDGDEWFQPNLLYRAPFTLLGNSYFYWGRCCLDRHLEYAFSDVVAASDDDTVRMTFENMFEDYASGTLRRSGLQVLNEREVRERFSITGPCCDFALFESDAVILVEAKSKALVHSIPATGTVRTYRSKLKTTILKAADQLENTEAFVRKALPGAKVYRSVVTYGDLHFGSADYLFRESGEEFSRSSLYIFSIDQLEQLAEAVNGGQCTFGQFFETYAQRHAEMGGGIMSMSDLLSEAPFRLDRLPKHIQGLYQSLVEPMLERFKPPTNT